VDAVLRDLRLGHRHEDEFDARTIVRLRDALVVLDVLFGEAPAEGVGPPLRLCDVVACVEYDGPEAGCHGATHLRRTG
jgi:hypothetical protein